MILLIWWVDEKKMVDWTCTKEEILQSIIDRSNPTDLDNTFLPPSDEQKGEVKALYVKGLAGVDMSDRKAARKFDSDLHAKIFGEVLTADLLRRVYGIDADVIAQTDGRRIVVPRAR